VDNPIYNFYNDIFQHHKTQPKTKIPTFQFKKSWYFHFLKAFWMNYQI